MKLQFTVTADQDLDSIWQYNADRYSLAHADKYRAFLISEIQKLLTFPRLGHSVDKFSELRCLIMKWRPGGYGHAAYYEIFDNVIRITRVLHSSQDSKQHL